MVIYALAVALFVMLGGRLAMPFHYIDHNGQVDLDQFIIDSMYKPLEKRDAEQTNDVDWSVLKPYKADLELDLANRRPESQSFRHKENGSKPSSVAISPFLKVGEIMTRSVERLNPGNNLQSAFELFERFSFRHIPITMHNGQLIGMLSDRDIVKRLYSHSSNDWSAFYDTPLKEVMSSPVLTVTEDTPVQEVADLMATHNIGSIPVVQRECYNEEPLLQGIVTKSDLFQLLVEAESLLTP